LTFGGQYIPAGKYLNGRGGKHQIDSLAIYPFSAPFVFPTRLIAEAKLYDPNKSNNKVGISIVRNLHSTLIDLEQTLPRDRNLRLDENWDEETTCNYQGGIFSTAEFSKDAFEYANAYSIDTVCLENQVKGISLFKIVSDIQECIEECKHCCPPFHHCLEFHHEHFRRLFHPKYYEELHCVGNYSELTSEGKSLFFKLLEFIIEFYPPEHPCPIPCHESIMHLKENFFSQRLASLEGNVLVLHFPGDDFNRLRSSVARKFMNRIETARDPFYPPPESSPGEEDFPRDIPPSPLDPVSFEGYPSENEEGPKKVEFFLTVGKEQIKTETKMSNSIYEYLISRDKPRRLVIPVDYGCFFTGVIK